tara:strand:- start:1027 stop:1551 length:525 start_codon:yes stop_codon:yes gene_type:complete
MDSISRFAEGLIDQEITNIQEGKSVTPSTNTNIPQAAPAGKDIRNISVPDEFMQQILGENYHPQDTPTVKEIPELVWADSEEEAEEISKNSTPEVLTESTAQDLIPLLKEVRNLLQEMTTAGGIGVNLGGPQKPSAWENIEKSYGYKKSKKASSSKKSRKALLKKSIKNRLRRK